jgi:hypothetical protein
MMNEPESQNLYEEYENRHSLVAFCTWFCHWAEDRFRFMNSARKSELTFQCAETQTDEFDSRK